MSVWRDFIYWFNQYNQEKKNQQSFGVENFPARAFRRTISLATAGTLRNLGIPFNGVYIESIKSVSGAYSDGFVTLNFDHPMINSAESAVIMRNGDSAFMPLGVSNVWLSWTAQAGLTLEVVFLNDIDFRKGNQKVSIDGTVPISGTVNANILNNPLNVNVAGSIPLSVSVDNVPYVNISNTPLRVVPWKPSKVYNVYAGGRYKLNEEGCAKVIWCGSTENDENAYAELRIDGKLQAIVRGPLKSYYYECYTKFGQTIACNAESGDSIARLEQY